MDDLISDEFRREICDWFRANDVDPSLLPAQPKASIHEGLLTFRQRVPGSGDGCLMDPDEPGMPLLRTVTVPLRVQPPERVAQWLGPACPTCGR